MKTLIYFTLFFIALFPNMSNAQVACATGSDQETCSANIPADAIVIQGHQTYSNVAITCFWVCPGDSLTLNTALDCSVYMEPKARLWLFGSSNTVWAKSECRVEILAGSTTTHLGITEDVIFIDEGTNTMETICGISTGVSFDYMFAPEDGCDLSSAAHEVEPLSVQFYPNPVNGKASVSFSTQQAFYGEIYLSDSFGRVVKKWKSEGQQILDLPLEGTNPGVYLIHVPGTGLAKKIVVF